MRPETNDEYSELKEFLSFYSDRYFNVGSLPPEKRPIANLKALEEKSMKAALNGLHQEINDCIEMSFHLDPEEVDQLDKHLRDRNIVTLSELRRRYSKRYATVVKRGQIKSDTEYYLIRNVLNDPTAKADGESELLQNLVADYENA
jgi:hypothetical protein